MRGMAQYVLDGAVVSAVESATLSRNHKSITAQVPEFSEDCQDNLSLRSADSVVNL